jgi:hypothetical protein
MRSSLSTIFLSNLTIDERQRVDRKIAQSREWQILTEDVFNRFWLPPCSTPCKI